MQQWGIIKKTFPTKNFNLLKINYQIHPPKFLHLLKIIWIISINHTNQ